MAMAICSCSKQYSPPLNNIPSTPYAGKSNLKLSGNSSSSYTCSSTVQYVSLSISTVDILKHEGAELVLDREEEEVLDINGSGVDLKSDCWSSGVLHRRKRRRKRRSRLECEVNAEDVEHSFSDRKAGQSCILSSAEEARFSWYIKEKARIEAVRMELLADTNGHEVDSRRWSRAAGISHQKLDKILCNGRLSEERIVSSYQRFVGSIAASYQGKGLSLEDLTQEGSIGLLRGATKYNPEKGYKLSTYAYWWVRQAITRAKARKSKLIRLPGSIIEHMPKICEAINMLSGRLKRFPTYDEIAEVINVKPSVVRLALESTRSPISLDKTINCMSIQDIIPGPNELTPDEMMRKDLVEPEVEKLLEVLCEKEAHVLRLYYGLNGNTPWSFEEIGKLLKLSRERVRQINSTALSKLRKIRGINDLKYFV